jgi:hypothetical protein
MMRAIAVWGTTALVLLMQGCAAPRQQAVTLPTDYFSAKTDRIGVAMTVVPKPDTSFPGAGCLLCLATASAANGQMTKAVQTWPSDDVKPLKSELAALLKAKSQQTVELGEPIELDKLKDRPNPVAGFARKDFSALRASAGVDRLLVVQIAALGAWRNYSAYIPNGPPVAVFKAQAYIVDLTNHKYDWYQEFDISQAAEGPWDEPPKFPGLTNAYFQVLERGKDSIKKAIAP